VTSTEKFVTPAGAETTLSIVNLTWLQTLKKNRVSAVGRHATRHARSDALIWFFVTFS